MYKPDKDTQKLKDLIDDEFKVKGYIRWPFVESFLNKVKAKAKKEFEKKFEEAYITIPIIDPNIPDESITRFQANIMIKQGMEKVLDQIRSQLEGTENSVP